MLNFIKRIFIWWKDCTLGTQWNTFLYGKEVGTDEEGNVYYTCKKNIRRWVIYNGEIEASRIPPEWHAWLHRLVDEPPTIAPLKRQAWEKDHLPNLTGKPESYFPHDNKTGEKGRPQCTGDYEAWAP